MKLKITREQKIGLFAIITLSSIFILINYLKGRDLFSKQNTYFVIYENVEGLAPTGPVYIRGLKVGTVEKIKYIQQEDYFLVELKVKSDYVIADNSVAEIYSSDLLGGKAVRINIGNSNLHLQDKDTLLASSEPGLMNMITQELVPLKKQAEDLIANMNTTFTNINEMMDDKAKANIAASLANLRKTLENMNSISGTIKKKDPQISAIIDNLDKLSASLSGESENIKRGMKNFADISDSLKQADIAGTVNAAKSLLTKLQDPNGSICKLMLSDTLHNQINSLVKQLDSLVGNINKNPKKYIKISVF